MKTARGIQGVMLLLMSLLLTAIAAMIHSDMAALLSAVGGVGILAAAVMIAIAVRDNVRPRPTKWGSR